MAIDNAAPAVRPQYVMDRKVLAGNKDPRNLAPGRIWGAEYELGYTGKPLDMITAPLHTPIFIQLANFFRTLNDEGTGIPAFTHGERGAGVGRTAGGLAMLMGASNLTMKESFKAWDEMMAVFLEALYDWYMQFGEDKAIKGDFAVVVSGANAILARDALIEKLEAFAAATMNPGDIPFVDRYELVKIRAEVLGLPNRVVKSDKDMVAEAAAQQAVINQPQGGQDAGQSAGDGGLPQGSTRGFGTGANQGSAQVPPPAAGQGP